MTDHPTPADPGRHTLEGTIRVFLAEALILPTGLVTTAFLTRQLGPDGYGLFTLAATLVAWIEWTITAVFARATYKCISETDDWRPVGTVVLRLHLAVSGGCALVLALLAGPLAALLDEPVLAVYLRLFALDIPIFSLAHAHRNILVGIGGYRQRALISAGRWSARLVLIVVLVGLGLSVTGAILASIGASLVELAIARCHVQPSLFQPTEFSARRLLGSAVPLFLYAASMRLFDKLDLFVLKTLGASAAQAGVYGAAQNLAVVPGIFALSFSPLLLSTLTRLLRDGRDEHARAMARDAMRLVVLLLPFAGMTAGAAGEIVRAIAGPKFVAAVPLLALLIFGALAVTMISVSTAILTAAGKAGWTFGFVGPLVPLAIVGHLVMIPRFGPIGASTVTVGCAVLGALMTVGAVHRAWRIAPPLATLFRSVVLCGGAYALAAYWPAAGLLLLVKLPVIVLLVVIGFLGLGEFNARELALARSLIPWRKTAARDE